jgi:hypothetical protein
VLPSGWRVVADNARRGLVISIPPNADPDEAVRWLLHGAEILAAMPLPDWVAELHLTP